MVGSEQTKVYRTVRAETILSPSHTVGSEQLGKRIVRMWILRSVTIQRGGLGTKKLYTFVSHFLNFRMSPSHIVGLELKYSENLKEVVL